tara:strand:- start:120 stop:650 length:531 start_codon:yes stop_codon:yes gene_type:complete
MIKIKIDNPIDAKLRMKARKTMRGDIIILDHPDIDIVVSPHENRVVAYSKKEYGDHIYALQSRLFDYLVRKGCVLNGSVRSSNVYSSIQGFLLSDSEKEKKVDPHQVAIYLIAKFLRHELGVQDVVDDYQDAYDDLLTDPDAEDSTRLGKIPHQPSKGDSYANTGNYFGLYGYYGE